MVIDPLTDPLSIYSAARRAGLLRPRIKLEALVRLTMWRDMFKRFALGCGLDRCAAVQRLAMMFLTYGGFSAEPDAAR